MTLRLFRVLVLFVDRFVSQFRFSYVSGLITLPLNLPWLEDL